MFADWLRLKTNQKWNVQ